MGTGQESSGLLQAATLGNNRANGREAIIGSAAGKDCEGLRIAEVILEAA